MRRGDITSGNAFTAAVLSTGLSGIILAAFGILFYYLISAAMLQELEQQIIEDFQLYTEINQRDGLDALLAATNKAVDLPAFGGGVIGVFSKDADLLAGNISGALGSDGWSTQRLEGLLPKPNGNFRVFTEQLPGQTPVTMVIGQNLRLIETTQNVLINGLITAGSLLAFLSSSVGYLLSRSSYKKLQTLSDTLDDISRGSVSSRIPIGVANDQIDRIAKQVNGHLDRLAELTAVTKNTINSIAHDLRSPLNRATILLQGIVDQPVKPKTISAQLGGISAELANLVNIFETILRISRIEAESGTTSFARVDVSELISEVVETYDPVLENLGQKVQFNGLSTAGLSIFGDRSMLFQLMANLIENVSKHTPKGTIVTVSGSPFSNGKCLLAVSDNGPGIPASSYLDMLKPFKRMEESRSAPGNGLGLALVNAIINHHGATLTLKDNAPGLRVEMLFPVPSNYSSDPTYL
jgi:signal transduction histidine kinase